MSSAVKAAASQQNSKHSTGPRTEAGKAVSKLNALRHGATSKALILPGEDPQEYQRFEKALLADLCPTSEAEMNQARRVAALSWRLNRMYEMEPSVLASCMDHVGAETFLDAASLYTEPENEKRLRLFHRYLTSAERAYNKALADFRALQKENRRRFEEENSVEACWLDSAIADALPCTPVAPRPATPAVTPNAKAAAPVSFVSQKPAAPASTPVSDAIAVNRR